MMRLLYQFSLGVTLTCVSILAVATEECPLPGAQYLSAGDKILFKSDKTLALDQEFILFDSHVPSTRMPARVTQVISKNRYIVLVLANKDDVFSKLD